MSGEVVCDICGRELEAGDRVLLLFAAPESGSYRVPGERPSWYRHAECAPPVAHQSDENTPRGVSEGYTRRNGAEKP